MLALCLAIDSCIACRIFCAGLAGASPPATRSAKSTRIGSVFTARSSAKSRGNLRIQLFFVSVLALPALAQRSTGELRLEVRDPAGAGVEATVILSGQS